MWRASTAWDTRKLSSDHGYRCVDLVRIDSGARARRNEGGASDANAIALVALAAALSASPPIIVELSECRKNVGFTTTVATEGAGPRMGDRSLCQVELHAKDCALRDSLHRTSYPPTRGDFWRNVQTLFAELAA